MVRQVNWPGTVRGRRWLDGAALAAIVAIAAAIGSSWARTGYDDAYITYRYAWNFASGYGFVYNPGEHYIGTTAPLYALILGILGTPNPDAIPLISGVVSGMSLAAAGAALYVYAADNQRRLCGLLAGIFLVTSPLVTISFGGEMLFQLALILWAVVAYQRERSLLAAAVLAVAMLVRADAVLAAGVLAIHALVVQRRVPWREALVIAIILLPFLVLSYAVYDSLLPGTLAAKRAQRMSGIWSPFLESAAQWIWGTVRQGTSWMFKGLQAAPRMSRFVPMFLIGVPVVVWLYRFWLVPVLWSVLFVCAYQVLDVPFYHWYLVPMAMGLSVVAASGVAWVPAGAAWLVKRISARLSTQQVMVALTACVLLILAPGLIELVRWEQKYAASQPGLSQVLYTKTGTWLSQNTEADATVGYLEIGFIGYYARRHIIDQLGLVNRGVSAHIAKKEMLWAYETYKPDYIVFNKSFDFMGNLSEQHWFRTEYHQVNEIKQGPLAVSIFERNW